MLSTSGIDWLGSASVPILVTGILAFCALLFVALIHAPDELPSQPGIDLRTPHAALDEQLARGEISRDDYFESRKALDFKRAIV
jgi:hypothetical protein